MRPLLGIVLLSTALVSACLVSACSSPTSPSGPAATSPSGTSAPNLQSGLAGTWLVTRTLVTAVEGMPNGYQDQQVWTFQTTGQKATLSTKDGAVDGSYNGASWVFGAQYTDPRVGLPAHLAIEIIGVDPLKGTLENNLYDPTGFRPPSKEGFRLDGVRQ